MFSVAIGLLMVTVVAAAPGVILIGDSTVTDGAGWGSGFCADTTGLARCVNLSVSGTTTISWQGQPQYATMLSTCKNANTLATIQLSGYHPSINVWLVLAEKVMDTATFATNLESLVGKVKAAGLTDILGPYSNQTIAVAKKLGLPLLPLLADSMTYVQKLGKAQAMQFNLDYSTTNKDTTHLNALGNRYFGRIVADEVKKIVPSLAGNIVADAALSTKIAQGTL